MNIFALDESPVAAARMMCDKHVPKMVVESVQMLVSGALLNGAPPESMPPTKTTGLPHKGGYKNHPCTRWASTNSANWTWLYLHAWALCDEFKLRYGKEHFGRKQLSHLATNDAFDYLPDAICHTDFARALNQSEGRNLDLLDEDIDAVSAYRSFYMREKADFARWDLGREAPSWWAPEVVDVRVEVDA